MVVGGGSGIGAGIALALAADGCRTLIAGRNADRLNETAAGWQADPPLLTHVVDVTDRGSVRQLFDHARRELSQIDILVVSAGTNIKTRTMAAMTAEQWDHVLATNATGAFNCIAQVLPDMRARRDGLIINISSIAGKRAIQLGGVAYCASKFAMTALGTAVGNEAAANGVRVTNVYPGEVNTPILENRPVPVSEQQKAAMVQPEDVGGLVAAIAALPPRAHVPEIIIKPTVQEYV